MMIDRATRVPSRWIRRLLLLGQKADTASEYFDWIMRRGREGPVAAAFCAFLLDDLSSRWDLLQFEAMREDFVSIPFIRQAFEARGIKVTVQQVTTAPYSSVNFFRGLTRSYACRSIQSKVHSTTQSGYFSSTNLVALKIVPGRFYFLRWGKAGV